MRVRRTARRGAIAGIPLCLMIVLFIVLSGSSTQAQTGNLKKLWDVNLGLGVANEPLAVDLHLAGRPHLIISDNEGNLLAVNAEDGAVAWRARLEGQALTAPAIGDFLGRGIREILVAARNGDLCLYDPASGDQILRAHDDRQFTRPPTVFPVYSYGDDSATLRRAGDGFVLIDEAGNVYGYRFDEDRQLLPILIQKAGFQISGAPAAGPLISSDRFLAAVVDYRGSIQVFDPWTDQLRLKHTLLGERSIPAAPALGQLSGDAGVVEIVVGDASGYLHAFQHDPDSESLKAVWPEPVSIYGPPSWPLLTADLNRDGVSDVIAAHRGDLALVDGVRRERRIWSARHPIAAPPALAQDENGVYSAFIFDEEGTLYVVSLDNGRGETTAEIVKLGDFRNTPVVVASGPGENAALLAVESKGGRVVAIETPLKSSGDALLWETVSGTPWRAGCIDARYKDRLGAFQSHRWKMVENCVVRAKAAMDDHDWKKARDLAEEALAMEPENAEASRVRRRADSRARMPRRIAFAAGLLIFGAAVGRPVVRRTLRAVWLKQGETARKNGQFDRALVLYHRLLKRMPEDKDVNAQLAILFMKQGNYTRETIPIFERCYQRKPDNPAIVQALARAYLNDGVRSDAALEVYLKAQEQFEEPEPLHHAIGATYLGRNDTTLALRHLKRALTDNYQPHDLWLMLADAYLEEGARTPAALEAYETAYAARPLDHRLLLALAESYLAQGRMGVEAEEVYERLLEWRPDHREARLMLSRIKLRNGSHEEAIDHARRVLDMEPKSADALLALAHACLAAGRDDHDTLATYLKALETNPDDKEILTAAAHIYVQRELDDRGRDILRRAFHANPEDSILQRAVCGLAMEMDDRNLFIAAGQRLADADEASTEVWTALANAYAESADLGEHAEEAFRRALFHEPGNLSWLKPLGEIYAAGERIDAEALDVYLTLDKADALIPDAGAQLIRALLEAGRLDEALAKADLLSEQYPEDDKLLRLRARVDLESDQIDEAIRHFNRILERAPNDPDAITQVATAYARKNRLDAEALDIYARAHAIDETNPLFPIMAARAMAATGDMEGASKSLEEIAKKGREPARAALEEIQGLLRKGEGALPLRWLHCRIALGLGKADIALSGLRWIQKQRPDEAPKVLEAVDRLIALHPNLGAAHLDRGRILLALGRKEEAQAAAERALELATSDKAYLQTLAALMDEILKQGVDSRKESQFHFDLGCLFQRLDNPDRAIGCFQVTAQDFRFETESIKRLGQCLVSKGMFDLALQQYKRLHVDDEIKESLYDLAQRFEQKNDLVGAKTVYRQLFAVDVNYKNVKEKFEMLAGATSDPMMFEKTTIINSLSDEAKRRYDLLEEIGRGAMGIVYRARDNELQDIVALKILPDNLSNNPEAVRRFKAEARSARKLSHPNIVRIHDIGEEMGRKYISMEFIEGTDLKKRLRSEGPVPMDRLLSYSKQICAALAYAHQTGIVHRDIKPANIMVAKDDQVKITDFGIAKIAESNDKTLAGAVIGTPLYMSPEQIQGRPVDEGADIYSLGILLYELFSGRPPFTEGDLAYQHLHAEPRPLRGCPEVFAEIIDRCLKKERAERWESAADILNNLGRIG